MKGGSIAGSKLATITGNPNLPDVGGLFIRSQEFPGAANQDPDRDTNSPIANFQDQSFLSHNHTGSTATDGGGYIGTFVTPGYNTVSGGALAGGGLNQLPSSSAYAPSHSHGLTINANGGTETRPKNLNLWTYIRIN